MFIVFIKCTQKDCEQQWNGKLQYTYKYLYFLFSFLLQLFYIPLCFLPFTVILSSSQLCTLSLVAESFSISI